MLAPEDRRGATDTDRLRQRHRVVTHAERVWIIREADTTLAPNAPRQHCLLCESALSVRSTWEYPIDWAHLPDVELLQLFS